MWGIIHGSWTVNGQIVPFQTPYTWEANWAVPWNIPVTVLPSILNETSDQQGEIPPSFFGKTTPLGLGLRNSGSWYSLDNGDRLYKLKIHSNGAEGLTFYFDQFKLGRESVLFIYSEDRSSLLGPYTFKHNPNKNKFVIGISLGET
ncbi:MAG: hypothetical protein IH946_03455, partial [Bacteroidetes bacterium]|nr:hypothetical protein [Bacteroidota bacterium]